MILGWTIKEFFSSFIEHSFRIVFLRPALFCANIMDERKYYGVQQKNTEINNENLQILEGFRLLEDDFMTAMFQENKKAAELLLNILLK